MPLFQTIQVVKSQDVAIKGVHLCYNEQVDRAAVDCATDVVLKVDFNHHVWNN